MIIVKLIGGLGNQMFQYAFGRALSLRLNKPVKYDVAQLLDRSPEIQYTFREFELDVFGTQISIATQADLQLFNPNAIGFVRRNILKVYRRLINAHIFRERADVGYDELVFHCDSNTYYEGYWQTEKYFKPYEAQIRQDFKLKLPLSGLNLDLAVEIADAEIAVSMHIRRGDYVSNTQANEMHGTCSPAYYEHALEILTRQFDNIKLFVFSDEPSWVRANMQFKVPATYVYHNTGKASVEDMRLMSMCHHNIIANSSFSWWGAWLNDNPDKIVIAPKQWYKGIQNNPIDLLPTGWLEV